MQLEFNGLNRHMKIDTDSLIRMLILEQRQATVQEIAQIIDHVAHQPVSVFPLKINLWLRQEFEAIGVQVPLGKLPSAQIHLLKRIYYDGQWSPDTTITQFEIDLHKAVQHPAVQLWTYRWLGEHFVGFLAPSHVRHVPHPQQFIFVAYVADYGTIKTGFQTSGTDTIFTDEFEHLVRQR